MPTGMSAGPHLGVGSGQQQQPAPTADPRGVGHEAHQTSARQPIDVSTTINRHHGQGSRHRPRHHQLGDRGLGGRRADRHPERRGATDHAVGGRLHRHRRAAGRPARPPAGDPQPQGHDLLGQAVHRPPLTTRSSDEAKAVAFDVVARPGRDGPLQGARQAVRAGGDQRAGAAQARRRRREVPRREGSPRPSSPCRRTSTTPSARPPRTPGDRRPRGAAHHQRADRGGAAYGLDKKGHETVLVFDLGGGTFDVSLLDVGDGVVEVRATAGDTHLGGDDFDRRMVDHLAETSSRTSGIDLRKDPQALQRLFEAAEKAKIELSSVTQTQVSLPFITADADGPKHLTTTLMRSTFEQITARPGRALPGPGAAGDERREGHRERHRRGHPRRRLHPHPRRAGPGPPAHRRQGPEHDRQPGRGRRARRRHPGRRAQGRGQGRPAAGRHAALAGRGDARRRDDQDHRAQHDDPGAPHRDLLHRRGQPARRRRRRCCRASASAPPTTGCSAASSSTDIRPAPRGEPQIEVTFDIDANGILNVTARDKDTGAEQGITISESSEPRPRPRSSGWSPRPSATAAEDQALREAGRRPQRARQRRLPGRAAPRRARQTRRPRTSGPGPRCSSPTRARRSRRRRRWTGCAN